MHQIREGEMISEQGIRSYELGKSAAKEMRLSPHKVPHIDARGFLCHELFLLFGGSFGFVETPRKHIVLRFLERHFPIAPICRWHPPEDSTLERLGSAPDYAANGAEVYRLTPAAHPIAVFFVEPKPEPHPMGWFIPIFYNCPRLMLEHICRPPFELGYDAHSYELQLRLGTAKRYWAPLVSEESARDMRFTYEIQVNRGMWEVLSKYSKE
jgi:hypothetical protein